MFDRDQFGGFLDMIVDRDEQLTSLEYDLFGSEEGDGEAHQTLENIPQVEKNQLPCPDVNLQDMSTSHPPSTVQSKNVRVVCVEEGDW